MNEQRKQLKKITNGINIALAYLISGALIVYGGVNFSTNILQASRGMYTGQWPVAVPFVLIFGFLPVVAGILVLIYHPATRTQHASRAPTPVAAATQSKKEKRKSKKKRR